MRELWNAGGVPVSPATTAVREAFRPDDQTPPVAEGEGRGQVAGDEPGGPSRTRRIALVGACILAFPLGVRGRDRAHTRCGQRVEPPSEADAAGPGPRRGVHTGTVAGKGPDVRSDASAERARRCGRERSGARRAIVSAADAADWERGSPDPVHDDVRAVHYRARDNAEHHDA